MKLEAYTDGSNTYNGFDYSYGGYGWCIVLDEDTIIDGGGSMPVDLKTPVTNNRAELLAIISVLKYIHDFELHDEGTELVVYSDSQLCVNCANGVWKPKKNFDLWAQFASLRKRLKDMNVKIEIKWIKGHAGHQYNERADQLAGEYANLVRQEKPKEVNNKVNVL